MSGDPRSVHLGGDAMVPLVAAAGALAAAEIGPFAIIGGVAVNARLGTAHRATRDLDAVVDEDHEPSALEVLAAAEGAEVDAMHEHRLRLGGAKVELIRTQALSEEDVEGLTIRNALFVGTHRWALESAQPLTLVSDEGQATVPVARHGALIAMKLHAIQDRHGGVEEKRSGDAWDIFRLLSDLALRRDALEAEFASATRSLRAAVLDATERVLGEDVGRTVSWLRRGDELMAAVTAEELSYHGSALADALRSFRH